MYNRLGKTRAYGRGNDAVIIECNDGFFFPRESTPLLYFIMSGSEMWWYCSSEQDRLMKPL